MTAPVNLTFLKKLSIGNVLIVFLNRKNIHICVSEILFNKNNKFKRPNYTVYRKDKQSKVANGGVVTIIKR